MRCRVCRSGCPIGTAACPRFDVQSRSRYIPSSGLGSNRGCHGRNPTPPKLCSMSSWRQAWNRANPDSWHHQVLPTTRRSRRAGDPATAELAFASPRDRRDEASSWLWSRSGAVDSECDDRRRPCERVRPVASCCHVRLVRRSAVDPVRSRDVVSAEETAADGPDPSDS